MEEKTQFRPDAIDRDQVTSLSRGILLFVWEGASRATRVLASYRHPSLSLVLDAARLQLRDDNRGPWLGEGTGSGV
jgi:hypothetical protein